MEYQLGINCRPNYLRPSIQGLHLKIVERDTMDEVIDYLDSILDDTEQMQQTGTYWSYLEREFPELQREISPNWLNQRYGIMEFQSEDGIKWFIEIIEYNENLKDDYKEPGFKYLELDE
jgi:hypothetical protein